MKINRVKNIERFKEKKIIFVYDDQDFTSTEQQLRAEVNRILTKSGCGAADGWNWDIKLNDLTAIAYGKKEA